MITRPEERYHFILQQISNRKTIGIGELARDLEVSEMTVRRDLMNLEKKGLLKRSRGGATSISAQLLDDLYTWETRSQHLVEQKVAIARAAESMVRDGDSLFLHSGTTVSLLARMLRQRGNITIATNSMLVVEELAGCTQIDLIVIGGSLNQDLKQMNGPITLHGISTIRVDKVFMSCSSVSSEQGVFSTSAQDEVVLEQTSMRSARETYLLVDHSKFTRHDFWVIGNLNELDAVITDADIPEGAATVLQRDHTQCVIAPL
jgi:DeoR family transcriptional regulator, fructose operon transcriptional repressor